MPKHNLLLNGILAILIMLALMFSMGKFNFNNENGDAIIADEIKTSATYPSDSLPHYLYKKITDSIEQLQSLKKGAANDRGSGTDFLSIGYSEINNNFFKPADAMKKRNDKSYFLALSGYKLEPHSEFYVENGNWLIKTPEWDTIIANTPHGHYISKSSPVRFTFATTENKIQGQVLVPFNKGIFLVIRIFIWLLIAAMLVFGVYVLFRISTIMVSIINKKSFSGENYRSLLKIGLGLIVISYLPFLIGLIMSFMLKNKIPDEINYPFWENFIRYKEITMIGLIILLIANAFKQGHKFQIENETML